MRLLPAILLVSSGCIEPATTLFVDNSWSDDELGVLMLLGPDGLPLEDEPRLVPGDERLILSLPGQEAFTLYVEVFEKDTLEGCAVKYGTDGDNLPEPMVRLSSGTVTSTHVSVELRPVGLGRPVPVRLDACTIRQTICDQVMVEFIELPLPAVDLFAGAAVDRNVFAVGGSRGFLAAVDDFGGMSPIEGFDLGNRTVQEITWSHGDRILARAGNRALLFEDRGAPLFFINFTGPIQEIAYGAGLGLVLTQAGRIMEFTITATTPVDVTTAYPTGTTSLHATGEEVVAIRPGEIHVRNDDGWALEHASGDITLGAKAVGHRRLAVLADQIYIRNAERREWDRIPYPFEGLLVRSLDISNDGILVAGGENGGIALYDEDGWCRVPGSKFLDWNASSFLKDGRFIWLASNAIRSANPNVARITMPDP